MCVSAGVMLAAQAGATAIGGIQGMKGAKAGAAAMGTQARTAAIDAGRTAAEQLIEADQIQQEGKETAARVLAEARKFRGSQQVMAAASGFLVDSAGVRAFTDETEAMAQADALALLINADKQAIGKRITAESAIESGVSKGNAYVSQGQSIMRQGNADFLSSMTKAASLGYSSYKKFTG